MRDPAHSSFGLQLGAPGISLSPHLIPGPSLLYLALLSELAAMQDILSPLIICYRFCSTWPTASEVLPTVALATVYLLGLLVRKYSVWSNRSTRYPQGTAFDVLAFKWCPRSGWVI